MPKCLASAAPGFDSPLHMCKGGCIAAADHSGSCCRQAAWCHLVLPRPAALGKNTRPPCGRNAVVVHSSAAGTCCSAGLTRHGLQAFLNKHFKGCNVRWFAPERIRELAPSERGPAGAATFVSLEGLGRIPFSNIRRPKPLMDVGAGPGEQVSCLCSVRGRAGQLDNKRATFIATCAFGMYCKQRARAASMRGDQQHIQARGLAMRRPLRTVRTAARTAATGRRGGPWSRSPPWPPAS